MTNLDKLKAMLEHVINDASFQPERDPSGNVTGTHCNQAVIAVLNAFDYHKLDGELANDMCDYLLKAEEWIELVGTSAQKAANRGCLVMAAHPYQGHGHVAMIAPGSMVISGKWGVLCPNVANVGRTIGYMGSNEAFPVAETQPKYYMLLPC